MNFIDEEHIVRFEVGEQGREIPAFSSTGPEVVLMLTPISLATMLASVVLPSPGGPKISR